MPNYSVGKNSDSPGTPLPQLTDFRSPFRTLVADDGSPATVPANERLNGLNSRFGTNNDVHVLVNGSAAGVVVTLSLVENGVIYFKQSQTTTVADQALVFSDLPALEMIVSCTNVGAGVTLAMGVTR